MDEYFKIMVIGTKNAGKIFILMILFLMAGGSGFCRDTPICTTMGSKSYTSLSIFPFSQIKPRYLRKAEREAAKLERKKKRDFNKAIKENLKRSMEIQTPEVRERMKQNRKEANKSARERRKQNKARTKAAARKFR
jgi:DNA repair exonuclease SbcCD nuclease subunit